MNKTNIDNLYSHELFIKDDNEHKNNIHFMNNIFSLSDYSIKEKFLIDKMSKDELLYLLDLCNKTDCLDDSLYLLIKLIPKSLIFTISDKSYFEYPISFYLKNKRKILSKLSKLEQELGKVNEIDLNIVNIVIEEKKKVESEIATICITLIDCIDLYILKNIKCKQFEVFIYRIKAELYNIIASIEHKENKKNNFINQAESYYKEAISICDSIHNSSIRLEVIISFMNFYINTKNDNYNAYYLADEVIKNSDYNKEISEVKLLFEEIQNQHKRLENIIDK